MSEGAGGHGRSKGGACLRGPVGMGEGQGTSVGASTHGRKVGHVFRGQCAWEKGGMHLWGLVHMGPCYFQIKP